jgi:hypothetical protein
VLDPLYLILPVRKEGVAPGDLFAMGDLFARLGDVCLSAGCTPIFVHHLNKSSRNQRRPLSEKGRRNWDPPELFDLSQAGAAEYFRQWMLIGRRRPFDQEKGLNELWLSVGGSAGFSGLWAVDILEGRLSASSAGRRWDLKIRTRAQLIEEEQQLKVEQKATATDGQLKTDCLEVRKALSAKPEGDTKRGIRDGCTVSANRLNLALEELLKLKLVEPAQVQKKAGTAGPRAYDGYRLTELGKEGKGTTEAPSK